MNRRDCHFTGTLQHWS